MRDMSALLASTLRAATAAFRRLPRDRKGVTAVEYGVIGALIIVGSVVVIGEAGVNLADTFTAIRDALD